MFQSGTLLLQWNANIPTWNINVPGWFGNLIFKTYPQNLSLITGSKKKIIFWNKKVIKVWNINVLDWNDSVPEGLSEGWVQAWNVNVPIWIGLIIKFCNVSVPSWNDSIPYWNINVPNLVCYTVKRNYEQLLYKFQQKWDWYLKEKNCKRKESPWFFFLW